MEPGTLFLSEVLLGRVGFEHLMRAGISTPEIRYTWGRLLMQQGGCFTETLLTSNRPLHPLDLRKDV